MFGPGLMLHGGAVARRSLMGIGHGATVDLQGLQHLVDDAAFVRQIVAQEQLPRKATFSRPDARLVFLGGQAVTATSGRAGPAGSSSRPRGVGYPIR
jgi:hypothetical protein